MAINLIKFLTGSQADYNALKATTDTSGQPKRDVNTFYYCTDTKRVFLGDDEYNRPLTIGSTAPNNNTAGNYPLHSLYFNNNATNGGILYYTDGTEWHEIYNLTEIASALSHRFDDETSRTANTVLAGPTSGNAAAPSFRALVAADIPSLTLSKISDATDLAAIEALAGTSGFLKKTAANTWALESSLLYIASYGSSTYADVLAAYQENRVIYCRASSTPGHPETGAQLRMAFLAYVGGNTTTPTLFEFQYYRSVNNHTSTQQGDQVFVYTLSSNNSWSVATREAYTKINVGSGLSSSYTTGTRASISIDHPTGDGNLHVPATGTDNSGKFLMAGSTAGSLSWETIYLPTAGGDTNYVLLGQGTTEAPQWTEPKTAMYALINSLTTGTTANAANDYLITQYVNDGTSNTDYYRRKASDVRVGGLTTARTLSISGTAGGTAPTFNGTANATLSVPATMTGFTSISSTTFVGDLTGNASTATSLNHSLTFGNGTYVFDGSDDVNVPIYDGSYT